MRPTDLFPQILIDELLRLYRLDPEWVRWEYLPDDHYQASCVQTTQLRKFWSSGADAFAQFAASVWLANGPKVFIPTLEQCQALEQVAVNLRKEDYSQPYPALLVVLPKDRYAPFTNVLCHNQGTILSCVLHSHNHLHDITTTVARQDTLIEESLQKFDADCAANGPTAGLALRVACNSCLALSHYGNHLDYLFPKEVERDKRLGRERSERGERARSRIPLAVMIASLDQEVKLHRVEHRTHEPGYTGKSLTCHWRSGHWHTVAHGTGKTQRKRVLYPPVLVRADLFTGDSSNLSTTYKG